MWQSKLKCRASQVPATCTCNHPLATLATATLITLTTLADELIMHEGSPTVGLIAASLVKSVLTSHTRMVFSSHPHLIDLSDLT